MSRILVTGASGFVGRRLVAALCDAGHEVVAATRRPEAMSGACSQVVALDITDRGAFGALPAGIETIVHAAVERPRETGGLAGLAMAIQVNTLGTINVLQYAEASAVKKVVYCSTLAVYALPQPLPISEGGSTYPVQGRDGYYAISKLGGELACARSQHEGRLTCVCLRLGRIYGPGEPANTLLDLWTRQARRGEEIVVYGTGDRSLDFIYIDDAVRGIRAGVECGAIGGVFNIGSGVETTWRGLAEAIAEVFAAPGRRAPIRYVGDGPELRCYLDVREAAERLGFAVRVSLREGLHAWRQHEESVRARE